MKLDELEDRKLDIRSGAGRRWKDKAPEVASAAELLAKGGPMAAASRSRVDSFVLRESLKRGARFGGLGLERAIGDTLDIEDTPPTLRAREAGRPVARIVELLGPSRIGEGFATGFLVTSRLLMTNWHVFEKKSDALGCAAQFGFERDEDGRIVSGAVFELDPDTFFLSDAALDIAVVALKASPTLGAGESTEYRVVTLIPTLGKILVGHPVSIIQHPDGRHKHWAVRQNKLLVDPKTEDLFLSYTTDTLPGSSGSPAYNYDWELVAVHHTGVPRMQNGAILTKGGTPWKKGMPDSLIDWVANEGARVSKVHAFLESARMPDAEAQALLDELLAGSNDPVLARKGAPERAELSGPLKEISGMVSIVVNGPGHFHFNGAPETPAIPPAVSRSGNGAADILGGEKKLRFDSNYAGRPGYDSTFLAGFDVPHPGAPKQETLRNGNKAIVLDYHHYSLVMHKKRRLAMWTAANVDYTKSKRRKARKEFGDDTWKPDPRILIENQIEDLEFYEPAAKFDRGHLVRRDDVAWGDTASEEEFANSDSFHWTNCTPQHEHFNRDMFQYNGLWGQLENHIAKQAGFVQNRLTLFAGPFLSDDDPSRDFGSGIDVKVPIGFWKVVVAVEDAPGGRILRAYGFILDQKDAIDEHGWEGRFRAGKFKEQQLRLADITADSRVEFSQILHDADPLALAPEEARRRPLTSLEDVRLH